MTQQQLNDMLRNMGQQGELLIHINTKPTTIGSQLPDTIDYFNVWYKPSIRINKTESAITRKWLNDVIDRFVGDYVTYNNVLIAKEGLVKFSL